VLLPCLLVVQLTGAAQTGESCTAESLPKPQVDIAALSAQVCKLSHNCKAFPLAWVLSTPPSGGSHRQP